MDMDGLSWYSMLMFADIWWYQSLQSISRPKDECGRWGFMGRPLGRWVDWGWRDTAGTPSNCSDFSFLQAFGREFADGATVLVARADEVLRQQYEVFDFNLARVCQIWYGKTETHARTHTQSKNLRENSGNWVDNSGKSQRPRDCCSCQLRQVQGCHVWQPLGLDLSCRAVPLVAALREDLG